MNSEIYEELWQELQIDENVNKYAQKGHCRIWTPIASARLVELKAQRQLDFYIQIREIDIDYISHTFIRLIATDTPSYLFDGTGVGDYEAYCGPEAEANHLKGSRRDILQDRINLIHRLLLGKENDLS